MPFEGEMINLLGISCCGDLLICNLNEDYKGIKYFGSNIDTLITISS